MLGGVAAVVNAQAASRSNSSLGAVAFWILIAVAFVLLVVGVRYFREAERQRRGPS